MLYINKKSYAINYPMFQDFNYLVLFADRANIYSEKLSNIRTFNYKTEKNRTFLKTMRPVFLIKHTTVFFCMDKKYGTVMYGLHHPYKIWCLFRWGFGKGLKLKMWQWWSYLTIRYYYLTTPLPICNITFPNINVQPIFT